LVSNATNSTVYADDKGNTFFGTETIFPNATPNMTGVYRLMAVPLLPNGRVFINSVRLSPIYNPATGWIQNCNSTPYTASGASSPDKSKYPVYMAPDGENYRAITAIRILKDAKNLTLDDLIAKGYDHYLAAFDDLLPSLFKAYDAAPDSVKQSLAEPTKILQQWDRNTAIHSVASSLAIEWGTLMMKALPPPQTDQESTFITRRFQTLAKTISLHSNWPG
jgi:acyl-homoserine-lactone acylase